MVAPAPFLRLAAPPARHRHERCRAPTRAASIDEWIRFSGRHDADRLGPGRRRPPPHAPGCRRRRSSSTAATIAFYRRFMRSLTRQVRHLRRVAYDGAPGLPRLRVMIALAAAALSMSDQPRFLQAGGAPPRPRTGRPDPARRRPRQPQPRPPSSTRLIDLLPLRQAFAARGSQPSRILVSAIDRMMPMLRFFRQGDGSFAHFNGIGDTATDQLATVLAYDDVARRAARQRAAQRLSAHRRRRHRRHRRRRPPAADRVLDSAPTPAACPSR